MIRGIAHTAFTVSDMAKSLHFYCEILGFNKSFELNDDNGSPWIVYIQIRDGQFIELFYGGQEGQDIRHNNGFDHLCLEVDDIHEISNRLENRGVTLAVRPCQGKDLNYQCWVKDPDGNRIEFMQMHPDSPQSNANAANGICGW